MNAQGDLFGGAAFAAIAPAASRRRGPLAAQLAVAEHTANGKREANLRLVLGVVRQRPGLTMREIHAALPSIREGIEVSRRLWDLERLGLAEKGADRACTVSGREVSTFWPTSGRERGKR